MGRCHTGTERPKHHVFWERLPLGPDEYHEDEAAERFLLAFEDAARLAGVEWRARYNDSKVGTSVNNRLGVRRVDFQWAHGPKPYKLHFHVDIKEK